jgi:NTE family protein
MAYQFKNLVFEGGGVKGIAYVGAMEVLQRKGVLSGIERVGGTSAGAINATLCALGFSNAAQRSILNKLKFKNLMDDSWGVARDTERLVNRFGWYKGDFFPRLDWQANQKEAQESGCHFSRPQTGRQTRTLCLRHEPEHAVW